MTLVKCQMGATSAAWGAAGKVNDGGINRTDVHEISCGLLGGPLLKY